MSDSESDFMPPESSDEDLNELELHLMSNKRVKNENYLEDTVPQYEEAVFKEHFRMSTEIVSQLSLKFEESTHFKRHSGQFGKISAYHQVLICLWFLGHQTSSFRDVADRFNVTISSLYRILKRVILFLSNMSPVVIKWPDDEEKKVIEASFRKNGFPGIIGAIDGSHIKLDKPQNDPDSYLNRKGFYSMQVQVVCDDKRKIRDLFVGYPGSVHDSRVFKNSPLFQSLEEKCNTYFLLGDSGYPLQKKLLTPYRDRGQLTRRQLNYNIKLSKNRYVIEHCFGILKQKFRQLFHIKLRNITTVAHLIRATAVLHNICIDDEFNFNVDDNLLNDELLVQEIGEIDDDNNANSIRDNISSTLSNT